MKKWSINFIWVFIIFSLSACGETPPLSVPLPTAEPGAAVTAAAEPDGLASPSPADEESPPPEVPLYNDYVVSLEVNPETRTVSGIERVLYTNRTAVTLEEIVMRVYLNAFNGSEDVQPYFDTFSDKIFALGQDYGYMDILHVSSDNTELTYDLDQTVLTVRLDEPLAPEQTVSIKIQFDAYIPRLAHRVGGNEKALWGGMFLPVLSVYGAAGWHTEPYYPAGDPFLTESANFTVDITTPLDCVVAGTGIKKEEEFEDKKVTLFNAKMARDFAFAISPEYQVREAVTDAGVTAQFYYYSGDLPLDGIMAAITSSLEYFTETVGPYPYQQISVAETDMFVNGQEFSAMAFIDSAYLHRSPDFASIVHEVGNQWFNYAVGSNPMTQAWLDEGITMYLRAAYFFRAEEDLRAYMQQEYATLHMYLSAVTDAEKKKITAPAVIYENWNEYYQMNYTKAKLMLYALRQEMGPEAFARLIPEYFKAYSFRIATASDFVAKAEEVHGKSLTVFFYEWLNGDTLPELEWI